MKEPLKELYLVQPHNLPGKKPHYEMISPKFFLIVNRTGIATNDQVSIIDKQGVIKILILSPTQILIKTTPCTLLYILNHVVVYLNPALGAMQHNRLGLQAPEKEIGNLVLALLTLLNLNLPIYKIISVGQTTSNVFSRSENKFLGIFPHSSSYIAPHMLSPKALFPEQYFPHRFSLSVCSLRINIVNLVSQVWISFAVLLNLKQSQPHSFSVSIPLKYAFLMGQSYYLAQKGRCFFVFCFFSLNSQQRAKQSVLKDHISCNSCTALCLSSCRRQSSFIQP